MKRLWSGDVSPWLVVVATAALSCGVIGLPGFVLLTRYLPRATDLRSASAWFLLSYVLLVGVVVETIVAWLHHTGRSLASIGWRRATTPLAMVLAIVWAGIWLAFSLLGANRELSGKQGAMAPTELSFLRVALACVGLLISIGEEIINRGFIISELQRAHTATWVQVAVSGLVFAVYHSLGDPSPLSFIPSFVFGSVLGGLYVLGNRSLTPSVVSHGLTNLLGEPILVMELLASGYVGR